MAKKEVKNEELEVQNLSTDNAEVKTEVKEASVSSQEDKKVLKKAEKERIKAEKENAKLAEKSKTSKAQKKQKTEKRSMFKRLKETSSELKKVSWPSFGKVLKQTGVVILVVTICTLLLFGVDKLFSLIYEVLTKK